MGRANWQKMSLTLWNGLGIGFLFVAVAGGLHTFSWGLPSIVGWHPEVAANVMAGAGAVAAIFFGLAQWSANHFSQQSKHLLETAREGIQRAYAVLDDDEPSRIIAWVNAARLVRRSLRLASKLTDPDHQDAWKVFREEWCIRFMKFLDGDLAYYFGVGKWQRGSWVEVTPQLIARMARDTATQLRLEIDGKLESPVSNKMISPAALKAVFEFVVAYDEADEALDGLSDFTSEDQHTLIERDHYGLYAFNALCFKYRFSDGQAHPIEPPLEK